MLGHNYYTPVCMFVPELDGRRRKCSGFAPSGDSSEVSRGLHCLNEVCNCRDVTSVNSLEVARPFLPPKTAWE